ncbi:uncharacterized protein [Primulina eburnea]|uniref:uncharacterized protein isoform X2 n=1 Tax=Primulina eburnea TaxID=1245227 RepID=UPI003C6C45DE
MRTDELGFPVTIRVGCTKIRKKSIQQCATEMTSKRKRINRNEPKKEEIKEQPQIEEGAQKICAITKKADQSPVVIVFAHGAGAPSSSDWMRRWKDMLAEALNAVEVVTFDYPCKCSKIELFADFSGGKKRSPPKAEKLVDFHCDVVRETMTKYPGHPLVLAGKSMGSRVSCMVAGKSCISASAIICLGYPLKGTNGTLRDETLLQLTVPVMFVQGSKDGLCPLDKLEAVMKKMKCVNTLHVIDGGDHSFKIGKKYLLSVGSSQEEIENKAVEATATFVSLAL